MTTVSRTKSYVLRLLGAYDYVALRIALCLGQRGSWDLHTLVIDAVPKSYRDMEQLGERYNLQRFTHVYPTAFFVASVEESSLVASWFDNAEALRVYIQDISGAANAHYTPRMPELQEQVSGQNYYYGTVQDDPFDRMRWPHTVYTFKRTQALVTQNHTANLAAIDPASRSFANFQIALRELIYGEQNAAHGKRQSADPCIALRLVHEKPYFADIESTGVESTSVHQVAILVQGPATFDTPTAFHLNAPTGQSNEMQISAPGRYRFEVESGLPKNSRLTLVQGQELLDEYRLDAHFVPIEETGAPTAGELPSLVSSGERKGGSYNKTDVVVSHNPDEDIPRSIAESILRFRRDYPDKQKTAFIMMRFGTTETHRIITQTIKETLAERGLTALRADDKWYDPDLYTNMQTYMYGCGFGIAVFERIESDAVNPNVALEVGYMSGLRKPVCLLKDRTITVLQADLMGRLYKPFDPQHVQASISEQLTKWLEDDRLL